jgi:hypothetical protein
VARVFEHVAAVAGSVVALTWVLFALSYTGRRDSLDLRTVGVFSVEPAVYAVSVVTDLGVGLPGRRGLRDRHRRRR